VCFAFEASDGFSLLHIFIAQDVGSDSFYSYATRGEILITRKIDLAHGAAAESFLEEVTRREYSTAGKSIFSFGLVFGTNCYVIVKADFTPGAFAH
jgi:hypothetical protein